MKNKFLILILLALFYPDYLKGKDNVVFGFHYSTSYDQMDDEIFSESSTAFSATYFGKSGYFYYGLELNRTWGVLSHIKYTNWGNPYDFIQSRNVSANTVGGKVAVRPLVKVDMRFQPIVETRLHIALSCSYDLLGFIGTALGCEVYLTNTLNIVPKVEWKRLYFTNNTPVNNLSVGLSLSFVY